MVRRVARCSSWGDERGSNLVEFAIVLPLFLVVVFGIIEFGATYKDSSVVGAAAREAARLGAVNPDVAVVQAKARDVASGLPGASMLFTVTVTCERGGAACVVPLYQSGDTILVSAEYQHNAITPLLSLIPGLGETLMVRSRTAMRVE